MKELRSVVNAVFVFLVFLFCWSFFVPGHSGRGDKTPRFLRMTIDEGHGRHGDRLSFSIPYSFVRGSLRLAATNKIRRELDLHIHDEIGSDEVRSIWKELTESPEGTEVRREEGDSSLVFTKQGPIVTLTVHERREPPAEVPEEPVEVPEPGTAVTAPEPPKPPQPPAVPTPPQVAEPPSETVKVTIRFPAKLLEAIASEDRSFDVDALLDLFPEAGKGEVLSVEAPDGRVRVWIE